jgi:hypothetical protein
MSEIGDKSVPGRERWLWLRRPAWIVLFAVVLRVAVMGVLLAHNKLWWGANELGGIARAMLEGRGFSSAFHDAQGPTAWFAPAYPALLACIFRVFGIETRPSAVVAILLNVIFSSATAAVIVQLGREQFNEAAGVVAGWAWAVAPPLLFIPWLPWETCLSGLVFAFGFMITLRLGAASRLGEWAWCGVVWGLGALVNPAIVAPLPILAVCAVLRSHRLKGLTVLTTAFVLCVAPWSARNFRAFGHIVPVRSNFWPELYFANADFSLHPLGNSMLYQREGEGFFVAEMRGRAISFIRSNPSVFWRLSRERIVGFWAQPEQLWPYTLLLFLTTSGGVVVAARRGKRWAEFMAVLLVYPLVYYITHDFARFRYPIEPAMYLLAGYCVCELWAGIRARRRPMAVMRTARASRPGSLSSSKASEIQKLRKAIQGWR